MKTIFFFVVLLCGFGVVFAAFILLEAAANAIGFTSVSQTLDAATAAVKAYPSAEVGHLIVSYIVMSWKSEVAKLMFWLHLFS